MHNEKIGEKIEILPSENVFDDFEISDKNEAQGEVRRELISSTPSDERVFVQPVLPDGKLSSDVGMDHAAQADILLDEKDISGSVNRVCEVYGDNPFLLNNEINKISRELNGRNG